MDEQRAVIFRWHWVGERHTEDKRKEKRVRKRSMVICPSHRAQFICLHPNAREGFEYFDLTECEYCKREKSATELKQYTEEELKEKVDKLIVIIRNHFESKTHTAIDNSHVLRTIIRYFNKAGYFNKAVLKKYKVKFKKIKPEKLSTLLDEWTKQNENERNILSQAYEKGVLDDMYGIARSIYFIGEFTNRIFPSNLNWSAIHRENRYNKRSI
jgi:hypothetical protein